MLARLLFLFLATPVIELALLIKLGDIIGFFPTVALILLTGITGSYLAKREGLSAWKRLNQKFSSGGLPGKELLDGVIILVAGAMLITPGVLTDLVGFAGLIPLTRKGIRKYALKRIKRAMKRGTIRTSWGTFSTPTASNPSDEGGEAEERQGSSTAWQGAPREVPRHTEKAKEAGNSDQEPSRESD